MRRICSRLLVMAALVTPACITSPPYLEVEGGAFAPKLSGNVGLGGGDDVSVDSELGLDDREVSPYAAVRAGFLGINASLSGFRVSTDGSGTLSDPFGVIPAGTQVDSDFDLDDAKLTASLTLFDLGPFRFAAGLGAEYLNVEFKVRSDTIEQKIEAEAPVPLVLAEGELELGPFRVLASFGGMTGEFGDTDGTFLDGELTARIQPFSLLEIFVGYRYLSFELSGKTDGQEFESDLQLDGFMAGLTLRF